MDPFCSRDTGSYLEPARARQAASWWAWIRLYTAPRPPSPASWQQLPLGPGLGSGPAGGSEEGWGPTPVLRDAFIPLER